MVSAPWDASPSAMLHVLDGAEATRHQNKLILRNAFNWRRKMSVKKSLKASRQLLKIAEELPQDAHALNVCTLVHRLAKGEVVQVELDLSHLSSHLFGLKQCFLSFGSNVISKRWQVNAPGVAREGSRGMSERCGMLRALKVNVSRAKFSDRSMIFR